MQGVGSTLMLVCHKSIFLPLDTSVCCSPQVKITFILSGNNLPWLSNQESQDLLVLAA